MYKLEKVILWLSIKSLFSSNYRLRTRYKNNETLVLDSFCSEAKKKKKFIMKNDTGWSYIYGNRVSCLAG